MTRWGVFVVRLDLDTREIIRVETQRCVGKAVRLGGAPADGEVCGRPGRYPIGDLWLCSNCLRSVARDAEAQRRAGQDIVAPSDRCVFPGSPLAERSITLCGEPATGKVGRAPACASHYRQAIAMCREDIARENEELRQIDYEIRAERQLRHEQEMAKWDATGSHIVYYVLRGDGAVKIGTSTVFAHRLRTLTREHGPLEVLLTHCGDRSRETEMHSKFDDLALGGEWFRGEKRLLRWIAHVRRKPENYATVMPGTVPYPRVLEVQRKAPKTTAPPLAA